MKTAANSMRAIRVAKLTLNIGAGEAGEKLDKAKLVLERIAGAKPVTTNAHERTTFGTPKGKPIGTKVTLRGAAAMAVLKKLLDAKERRLKPGNFDKYGNFAFGIEEYINIPGMKYDPDVGIMGLDVAVTLERPGYRVKRRKLRPAKVGKAHQITKEDAIAFATGLGVVVSQE
ncbi:MAG: 50S ribosomal protein L5 [Candidatus Aenigmarchaeota archaeon]|nr:50S ribosomal protein L5 [Candidatus Aenigmarchaeota archaeon]